MNGTVFRMGPRIRAVVAVLVSVLLTEFPALAASHDALVADAKQIVAPPTIKEAERIVRKSLSENAIDPDPASIQLKDVAVYRAIVDETGVLAICGQANTKNLYGKYNGWANFHTTINQWGAVASGVDYTHPNAPTCGDIGEKLEEIRIY